MRLSFWLALGLGILAASALPPRPAHAAAGVLSYHARVVHHNRDNLSYVQGTIDMASSDFEELVERNFRLDWKQLPGRVLPVGDSLPSIWEVGGKSCQRLGEALPRYESPLLRHFIVGQVIPAPDAIKPGASYLSGQLVIQTATCDAERFEIVASFNGSALVVVGRREQRDGQSLTRDLAVLGPQSELYQYFIDDISWSPDPPQVAIALPAFNREDYVAFPEGASQPVAIRPIKDWLVFQAQLPSGRPLNLVFDSGAETMILDELVLKLDAKLSPAGELPVAGAYSVEPMRLYKGFSFEVGGVKFKNLPVFGTTLTSLTAGAGMRIHGVVGNEILQLCRLDIDLKDGQLKLAQLSEPGTPEGTQLKLTFINELPHVQAQVQGNEEALLLVDTGQRTPLSVNLDYLDQRALGDDLVMDGFLGDIAGGLVPRYMVEQLDVSIAGRTYREKSVDAAMDSTYSYEGVPVVGSIGFPLLARHFGGITFDYSRDAMFVRNPGDDLVFTGNPKAWDKPAGPDWRLASAGQPGSGATAAAAAQGTPAEDKPQDGDSRRPKLVAVKKREAKLPDMPLGNKAVADPLSLVRAAPPADAEDAPPESALSVAEQSFLMLLRDAGAALSKSLAASAQRYKQK